MGASLGTRLQLNDRLEMPILGLGVYQSPPGNPTRLAVGAALGLGYRLVDTARIYGNEADVGRAIRDSGISRDEVFVTTKLWNSDHGYDSTLRACEESLRRLGLDYVDLYLIHWPVSGLREETWKAMKLLKKQGKCRSIGVSNYTIAHLTQLLSSSDTPPAVNQVEFHPFLHQRELLSYCQKNRIQLEAYSPLARGHGLSHPVLKQIASRHGKTSAQIMIRWCMEKSVVAIPKSIHRERILENSQVFDFELSDGEMRTLDSLDGNVRTNWDPSGVP